MSIPLDRADGAKTRFRTPAAGTPAASALRRRYREYRHRQAVSLLELVPREGVRPLYRQAREWAISHGMHEPKDPMATLHRFCGELLPLPSFEIWMADYENHRLAHLKAGVAFPHACESSEPVTVEHREVVHDGDRWHASLDVYRNGNLWRGYLRFYRQSSEADVRTGDIFCEEELQDVRKRFLSFTPATLAAFLRSVLP